MSAFASGSTNHELEDEDFSLVYCASCRKDAVDAASGRLREDDFCIVECCQAGQSGLPCVVDQISIVADV